VISTSSPIIIATRLGSPSWARHGDKARALVSGDVALLDLERREGGAAREARNAAGLYHTAFPDADAQGPRAMAGCMPAANKIPADRLRRSPCQLNPSTSTTPRATASRSTPIGPPELWKWDSGTVTMATDQLDIDGLLALHGYGARPTTPRLRMAFASATCIFAFGDLEQADRFYSGTIGLDPTRKRSGAAFLSSGRYHPPTSPSMSGRVSGGGPGATMRPRGLAWFSLEIATTANSRGPGAAPAAGGGRRQRRSLTASRTSDPWGTKVRLIKV